MKNKQDFRDTPIGEVFEQTRNDLALIQTDVKNGHFKSAIAGMDFQIKSLTQLRANMQKAFEAGEKYGSKFKHV